MIKVLGRKKRTEQSRWLEVWDNIENYVSRGEVLEETEKVVEEIRKTVKDKRVAFSWSGGKDSIVLADVCKRAGVEDSMFAHTELEYPVFLDWCMKNKPEGCEVINLGYDLEWLNKHPYMLFPNKKYGQHWMVIYQRKSFTEYFFGKKLDMLLVGHRKADGNIVGENNIIRKGSGEVRYSPLADWSHELLLAYIHYFDLPMPPIYRWKNGFICGTHPWAKRGCVQSIEQGYREVYEIDPSIVINAADTLESARRFLEKEQNKNE